MKQVCITHPDPVIRSSLKFQQLKMKPCTFISFSLNKLLLLLLLKSECVYNLFGTTIWMLIKIWPELIVTVGFKQPLVYQNCTKPHHYDCAYTTTLYNVYHSYGFKKQKQKKPSQCQLWMCCFVFYPLKRFHFNVWFYCNIVIYNKKKTTTKKPNHIYVLCRVCGHFIVHFVLDKGFSWINVLFWCWHLVYTYGYCIKI